MLKFYKHNLKLEKLQNAALGKINMFINDVVSEEYAEIFHGVLMLALPAYARSTVQH